MYTVTTYTSKFGKVAGTAILNITEELVADSPMRALRAYDEYQAKLRLDFMERLWPETARKQWTKDLRKYLEGDTDDESPM